MVLFPEKIELGISHGIISEKKNIYIKLSERLKYRFRCLVHLVFFCFDIIGKHNDRTDLGITLASCIKEISVLRKKNIDCLVNR